MSCQEKAEHQAIAHLAHDSTAEPETVPDRPLRPVVEWASPWRPRKYMISRDFAV